MGGDDVGLAGEKASEDPTAVSQVDRLRPRRDEDEFQSVERYAAVAALRDAVGEGRLAPAVGGRCVEGAGASPVAVARHELLDLQLPFRFGHRSLGANGGRRQDAFSLGSTNSSTEVSAIAAEPF